MHGFKSTFLFAMLAMCGTLVAAEPATSPAPAAADADAQRLTDQIDKLIVTRLKPAPQATPLRVRAFLRNTSVDGAPATQPAEVLLELADNDVRQLKQDERDQRKLDDLARALAEQDRAFADAAEAMRRTLEQPDGTYLGIGVEAPDETLRAQLSLPPGAGLVINFVDENGPAKSAVQLHDVLQKLDDQLLINGEQLVALVRMHKPGDTVSLTLLRRAKPVTVEVELGRRKVSQQNVVPYPPIGATATNYATPQAFQAWTVARQAPTVAKYNTVNGDLANYWTAALQPNVGIQDRPTTFNDGELLVSFTCPGDLLAVDVRDGKVLYHGRAGTEQQWNAMPKIVRDKLSSWRKVVLPPAATSPAGEKPDPRAK